MLSLFTYGLTFGTSEQVVGTKESAKQTVSLHPEDTPAKASFDRRTQGFLGLFQKRFQNKA